MTADRFTVDRGNEKTGKSLKVHLFLAVSPQETATMIGRGANLQQIARGEMKQIAASVQTVLSEQDEAEAEEIQGEYFHNEAESATAVVIGELAAEDDASCAEEVEEVEAEPIPEVGQERLDLDLADETAKSAIEL